MKASTRQLLVIVVALIALLLVITLFSKPRDGGQDVSQNSESNVELESLPVAPPPPITKTMQAVLDKSKGFNALISYTDNGFEPMTMTIKKGQTVRFTNNSSGDMWVSASAGQGSVYPGSDTSCGQSALDTCGPLAPNEIWEFTFDVAGTWSFRNSSNREFTGTVIVQ